MCRHPWGVWRGLKHASLELIVSLFHQMYEYATIYELVDKDYSAHAFRVCPCLVGRQDGEALHPVVHVAEGFLCDRWPA